MSGSRGIRFSTISLSRRLPFAHEAGSMKLLATEQYKAGVIARAIMPTDAFDGLTAKQDLGAAIAGNLLRTPWWAAIAVRAAIWVVWFAPFWRQGSLKTFGGLSLEKQWAVLELLARSDNYALREMVLLLKMNTCLPSLGDLEVLKYLGAYDTKGGPVQLRRSGT
jgi:hypothetical protein